jgi:hypothetical protein
MIGADRTEAPGMLDALTTALRIAAGALALGAALSLWNAAPAHRPEDAMRHLLCEAEASERLSRAMTVNPDAAMRRRAEFFAPCGPAPRREWEPQTLRLALMLGGGTLALAILSAILASMARRERLAAETLRELRRRHD